jgi:hypothetical protein
VTRSNVEQLAAKLGLAPTALSAFEHLTPEQIALLSDAIDGACARQRREREAALAATVPLLPLGRLWRLLR